MLLLIEGREHHWLGSVEEPGALLYPSQGCLDASRSPRRSNGGLPQMVVAGARWVSYYGSMSASASRASFTCLVAPIWEEKTCLSTPTSSMT